MIRWSNDSKKGRLVWREIAAWRILHNQGFKDPICEKQSYCKVLIPPNKSRRQKENYGENVIVMCREGRLQDAQKAFQKLSYRSLLVWTSMITVHGRHGQLKIALQLFEQMRLEGVNFDRVILLALLSACLRLEDFASGKLIHGTIIVSGFQFDLLICNAILKMYGKCSTLDNVYQAFDKMGRTDIVSWTTMIAAHIERGCRKGALTLFWRMQLDNVNPDMVMFLTILGACCTVPDGKRIHAHIVRSGLESEIELDSAIVKMYGSCGSLEDACTSFTNMHHRSVSSWTAMVAGYLTHGYSREALQLFWQMELNGIMPNRITFMTILNACSNPQALTEGRLLHAFIACCGLEMDPALGTVLVKMYGHCKSLDDVTRVSEKFDFLDVFIWTSLISVFSQHGRPKEALQLFRQMQVQGTKPNQITCIAVLTACANLSALAEGKTVHRLIAKEGFELDAELGNALINMYGRCGKLEEAHAIFDGMHYTNVISWTALIAAYAQHGYAEEAIGCFRRMKSEHVKSDQITFVAVLTACSRGGLLDEGCHYFVSFSIYGVTPITEHYHCIIDLLGRAGRLDQSEDVVSRMPFEPEGISWMTLLSACRRHGDIERGIRAAEIVLELDPEKHGAYVLLSNIYSACGRWADAARIRKLMADRGIKRQPGYSTIEVNNKVYEFLVGDASHPQKDEIYSELKKLEVLVKEAGYVPDMNSVLYDVEDEQKEHLLLYHSEKLAIAFGIISTPAGTPLRIVKNLSICEDCHSEIKFISKITRREILIRDASRFHRFENGICACGDYW